MRTIITTSVDGELKEKVMQILKTKGETLSKNMDVFFTDIIKDYEKKLEVI